MSLLRWVESRTVIVAIAASGWCVIWVRGFVLKMRSMSVCCV